MHQVVGTFYVLNSYEIYIIEHMYNKCNIHITFYCNIYICLYYRIEKKHYKTLCTTDSIYSFLPKSCRQRAKILILYYEGYRDSSYWNFTLKSKTLGTILKKFHVWHTSSKLAVIKMATWALKSMCVDSNFGQMTHRNGQTLTVRGLQKVPL